MPRPQTLQFFRNEPQFGGTGWAGREWSLDGPCLSSSTLFPLHRSQAVMTGSFHGLWLEGADPSGQNSHWFIIKRPRIWDYRWLHSSIPFPTKKGGNLFNLPLWCSFGGRPGTVGIMAGLKKGQNIRNREGLWPQLTGKKASWPVNKRCWVWSGKGRRHLAKDHSGQWGHGWAGGSRVVLWWKMGGGGRCWP